MKKFKSTFINVSVLLASLLFSFIVCEGGLRLILFSDLLDFDRLRYPSNYTNYFSDDDYFKLLYLFGNTPPANPHPLLGWVRNVDPETYRHHDRPKIEGRRPVLLYGDSFAGCVDFVPCFEDILNIDPEFAQDHYLLNYGVGNYGFDQIYLLFQQSFHLYEDPFVVMSLMRFDLDRSIQTARSGQKPYFTLLNGDLHLQNVPISPAPHAFFAAHPPKIKSYIFRRLLYSYMPEQVSDFVMGEAEKTAYKKAVNEKIILKILDRFSRLSSTLGG